MKLSRYLDKINKMVEKDKTLLDCEVIYAIDDEGNGFRNVEFVPSTGVYEDGEFYSDKDEYIEYCGDYTKFKPNAICIN